MEFGMRTIILFPVSFYYRMPGQKNRILYLVGVLVIAIPIAMYFTMDQDIKAIWYVNPLTRLPDFLIGMLLFHLYDKFKQKEWTYKQASVYETAVVLLFLLFICLRENIFPKYFVIPVITGCLSACCCTFCTPERIYITSFIQ